MALTTTRYAFPYQEANDPPAGNTLGQNLATAVETSLGAVEDAADARLDALEALGVATRIRWVVGSSTAVNSAAIGNTETVILTLSSFTFKANRAYQMVSAGNVSVSVASNTPFFHVRKTNVSGQSLTGYRVPVLGASTAHGFYGIGYFKIGGSDVSAALCLTLQGFTSFNATALGAGEPTSLNIFEVGSATQFSGAPALV